MIKIQAIQKSHIKMEAARMKTGEGKDAEKDKEVNFYIVPPQCVPYFKTIES